jgi:Leucine-rich repeat (LRR) protein
LSLLRIDGHNLTSLPGGSISGLLLGSLEKFSLTNGNLSDLSPETLANCKKLKRLDLHGNQFTALKRNQFKGLRDVELLDLSHNQIAKIDPTHLGDLTKMSWCNLSHNAISDITRYAHYLFI